jgi:hypothetical protein
VWLGHVGTLRTFCAMTSLVGSSRPMSGISWAKVIEGAIGIHSWKDQRWPGACPLREVLIGYIHIA